MEKSDNNLMKGVERLSKLMAHVQLLKGQVSIIERDLLLQELRDLYMEVLSMDVTMTSDASTVNEEAKEVVAFENIMKDVHEVEGSKPVQVSKVEEEISSKVEKREVEGPTIVMDAVVAEKLEKAVAEFKEEKYEEKVEVQQPVVETQQSVVEMEAEEEESPFAPAEPEPEMAPAPEPVMEKIEGNQYEELFEDTVAKVEVEKPVEKVETVAETIVEKVVEKVEPIVEKVEPVVEEKPIVEKVESVVEKVEPIAEKAEPIVEKVEPTVEKTEPIVEKVKPAVEEPRVELKREEVKPVEQPIVEHKVEKHEEKVVKEEAPAHKAEHKTQPKATQPSLFDYLSSPSTTTTMAEKPTAPTIADKLSASHPTVESQLEHKVNSQKVSDLRTVININDKFSFMTELFHNNMKAYNDFILKLNAISEREEAMTYVESVSKEYGWDSNSLAVKTFYKVMERKF